MVMDKIEKITNTLDFELRRELRCYVEDEDTLEEIIDKIKVEMLKDKNFEDAIFKILAEVDIKKAKQFLEERVKKRFVKELVNDYIYQRDWRVRENANMSYSLQGLNYQLSSKITAMYWLNNIYPTTIAKAHYNGDFHLHDLGLLSTYCVGWDLGDLLRTGFTGVPGKTSSKPPKHFRVALGQIVNFFYTLQGETAGAQAFSNFDTYLAPFVAYDKLSYEEVKQAMQEFLFNMNVPTRVGFQTPFSNITMDLIVPDFMRDEPVIIGGKLQDDTYGDFQEEVEIINRAFAELMIEGDANGRPFTFPIPTYNITWNFPWDNESLEPIWEMTAKFGIPYFSNFISSDMKPEDVRSMCCRLRLDTRELKKRGGGLFGAYPLTGSIGVVTINMPRIGYLAKDEDDFFERLDELMVLAKESLEIKRDFIEKMTENGLYPYARFYLRTIKQTYNKYWANHFSTIGLVGMNEALLNFMEKPITSEEGHKFAIRVLDYMRDRIKEFQEETGSLYNLEATPAEGCSYRLARIDKKKFPDIIVANENEVKKGAEPYYTNSTLPPVNWSDDLFEILDNQEPLQTRYTGGTVLHIWVGEKLSGEAVKSVVKTTFENYSIPYITITPTFSICPVHGYIAGEHFKCPVCNSQTEVYSRVVGYLRPVNQWNGGKQQEFKERVCFKLS